MDGRVGPFRLLEPLGEGGMGVVYRARSEEDGRLVALKMVRVPHAGMLQSLRREIYALAQLRHPGIVRILGEGVREGMPWYAMELLEGVTLRHWAADPSGPRGSTPPTLAGSAAPPSRLPPAALPSPLLEPEAPEASPAAGLRPCLSLVRRLCFALAYLHGEGLVHRDLKPDNILVRPDGQPVIVDFGLASRSGVDLSREALEVAGQVAGTVAYMAPEQGRGEPVDARADLYSLGCILYELCTGRPLFVGTTPMEVLFQHFTAPPEPPSRLAPGISPGLERLILRLLEKEPRARLGYADDVAAALGRLGVEGAAPAGAPPTRAYLYRPGFSGRRELLDRLHERLSALQAGSGGVLLIGGESGVGKTRLLVELSRLAGQAGIRVLTGECPPRSGAPLQAFLKLLQAVADRCREHGPAETQRLLGNRARVLAAYEPSLAGLPGAGPAGPLVELPPRDALRRLYHDLSETLAALVDRSPAAGSRPAAPLLLLLDDLQWADELSLGALEFWLRGRSLERLPLLVVGVYRSEECGPALRKLAEVEGAGSLKLDRLDGAAIARVVMDMLGLTAPPENFSGFLLRQSEGNPFFVAEYLRAAVGGNLLYRNAAGHWEVADAEAPGYERLPLPRSLLELIDGRLSRLSPDAQRLVEALSVLGREAEESWLAGVSGLPGSRRMRAALESSALEVLEPAEGEVWRFVHDKLREVAYARLEAGRRRDLHRAAAEALEVASAEGRDNFLGALALHWERGGEPGRSRPCHLAAARRERQRAAWAEAEAHYRAFLRLADGPSPESVQARNELGWDVLFAQGRIRDAVPEQHLAHEDAIRCSDRPGEALSLIHLGRCHGALGELPLARGLYERALDIARQIGSRPLEGRALGSLAALLHREDQPGPALEAYERALASAQESGDPRLEGIVLGNLAMLRHEQGHGALALELHERALGLARAAGDRRSEGICLSNLGLLHLGRGRIEKAARVYEQALELQRSVGDRWHEMSILVSLASVRLEQGRVEECLALFERTAKLGRGLGNRQAESYQMPLEARLARLGGRLEEAGRHIAAMESILLELGDRYGLLSAQLERGFLELAEVKPARAALERIGASDLPIDAESELGQALARLSRAQSAFERGEHHRLFRGELLEDLPEGLRRWLLETGQLQAGEPPATPPASP